MPQFNNFAKALVAWVTDIFDVAVVHAGRYRKALGETKIDPRKLAVEVRKKSDPTSIPAEAIPDALQRTFKDHNTFLRVRVFVMTGIHVA